MYVCVCVCVCVSTVLVIFSCSTSLSLSSTNFCLVLQTNHNVYQSLGRFFYPTCVFLLTNIIQNNLVILSLLPTFVAFLRSHLFPFSITQVFHCESLSLYKYIILRDVFLQAFLYSILSLCLDLCIQSRAGHCRCTDEQTLLKRCNNAPEKKI